MKDTSSRLPDLSHTDLREGIFCLESFSLFPENIDSTTCSTGYGYGPSTLEETCLYDSPSSRTLHYKWSSIVVGY